MSIRYRAIDPKRARSAAFCAAALAALLMGCASAKIQDTRNLSANKTMEKPDRILVYEFAVTPEEVELNRSVLASATRDKGSSAKEGQELDVGHAAAKVVAAHLVDKLRERGLVAKLAAEETSQFGTALAVEGKFLDISEGNRLSRTVIGFGVGATEMHTEVQGYYLGNGQRELLGDFKVAATGSKKPGIATPIGIGAATGMMAGAVVMSGVTAAMEVLGPLAGNAKDTAEQIAKFIIERYETRGWLIPTP